MSYFVYGGAMSRPRPDGGPLALALALAVVAFLLIAYVSGRDQGWKRAFQATLLVVLLGLPLGLFTRIIGASVGFGVGVVVALNPPRFPNVFRNRLLAVLLAASYAFVLLVSIPPAGVMTGAVLPPLVVGFADEFTAWRASRADSEG